MRKVEQFVRLTFIVGLAYSGAVTVRLYAAIFHAPAVQGPDGTLNAFLTESHLGRASDVRAEAERAGWPPQADVIMTTADASLTDRAITQAYYSISYALYPRRVWLAGDARAPKNVRGTIVLNACGARFVNQP